MLDISWFIFWADDTSITVLLNDDCSICSWFVSKQANSDAFISNFLL
jgi:hypothetical protein